MGGNHDFPLKLVRLAVQKNFLVEPFSAVFQKTSGNGKVYV